MSLQAGLEVPAARSPICPGVWEVWMKACVEPGACTLTQGQEGMGTHARTQEHENRDRDTYTWQTWSRVHPVPHRHGNRDKFRNTATQTQGQM